MSKGAKMVVNTHMIPSRIEHVSMLLKLATNYTTHCNTPQHTLLKPATNYRALLCKTTYKDKS